MTNQPDYKKAFESAIVELCQSIDKDEIKRLDVILTQEKSEIEILQNIVLVYPQFKEIFISNLNK